MSDHSLDSSITPEQAVSTDGEQKRIYIKNLFDSISHKYDLVNDLISLGGTTRWRNRALKMLKPPPGGKVLDVGTGTGDIPAFLLRVRPDLVVEGIDISGEMLVLARRKCPKAKFRESDATSIDAADNSYIVVTNAFVLRNLQDLRAGLHEMVRVLKPGGTLMCLDTFAPRRRSLWFGLMKIWLKYIAPAIAAIFTRFAPYQYLAASILSFEKRGEVQSILKSLGCSVEVKEMSFGTVVCILAKKADSIKSVRDE